MAPLAVGVILPLMKEMAAPVALAAHRKHWQFTLMRARPASLWQQMHAH